MATDVVKTRLASSPQTSQIEEALQNLAFGKRGLADGPGLTHALAEDPWAVRVWFSGFPRTIPVTANCGPVQVGGLQSVTSTTSARPPSSYRIDFEEAAIMESQRSLIKMLEGLSGVQRGVGPETEEETWDWDAVVEPPSAHPSRRITFHLVRRGYKEPRIVVESDD